MKRDILIDPSINKSSFNYVNCFEKPLGLILGNKDKNYQIIFFLYLKLIQSYHISCFEDDSLFYTISYNEALQYIFEDMLNIEVLIQEAECDSLHDVIKQTIDSGRYALVPGNLIRYPNCEYYEECDWKHLLLITGYDEEEKVYFVCDNSHEEGNDGCQYFKGTLSFDFVAELFEAASKSFSISTVWSVDLDGECNYTEEELVRNALDLYLYNQDKQPYTELNYLEQIKNEIASNQPIQVLYEGEEILKSKDFIFIRSIRYKEFFLQNLVLAIKNIGIEESLIEKVENISEKMIAQWLSIANNALINYHVKKDFDLTDQIVKVMVKERELHKVIVQIRKKL
jgi:hypothetical protein